MKATYAEAIQQALAEEMRRDEKVFLMGEDIAELGGIFQATKGLFEEFGEKRVRNTPISEAAMVGAGVGAAILGMRPVVEIQFADILTISADHIIQSAAKVSYVYAGQGSCPLVIRAPQGVGLGFGIHHSQSVESWFLNVPGLKIAFPSTPADAKGLLKTAIRDPDPVLFLEHKRLYSTEGELPSGEDQLIPFGRADVKRRGDDVTLVSSGLMTKYALEVAEKLAGEGIGVEVIDPRTLFPLDTAAILNSVRKTGKMIIVHEAPRFGGFGGEVAALVAENALEYLDAPVLRVAGKRVPVPFANEDFAVPSHEEIEQEIRSLVKK